MNRPFRKEIKKIHGPKAAYVISTYTAVPQNNNERICLSPHIYIYKFKYFSHRDIHRDLYSPDDALIVRNI